MTNRVPLVSVVLPVYNGGDDVGRAIDSIRRQTFGDWELIICDDGSSDGSYDMCRTMAASDVRINVTMNRVNLGLAKTMNRLVREARGKYIAVQEQDDLSVPSRLEEEVGFLESHQDIGLVSGIGAWVDEMGQVFQYFPGVLQGNGRFPQGRREMVKFLYVEQSKIVNAACMFRSSALQSLKEPFDENARMSIDWQFFVHLAHRYGIYGIPKVLVLMKRGGQHRSLTTNKELMFREARRCIRLLYERYRKDPGSPINYVLYRVAMSTEMTIEGRYWGGLRGLGRIVVALLYYPLKGYAWFSLGELLWRGARKLSPIRFLSASILVH
jgi:glycosyltransferase involved in cell wall biosynthesis